MATRDPYKYFRAEARELLDGLQRGVAELESSGGSAPIPSLLRFAHTLKGAARVVRLPAISDLAHHFEDVLAACRESSTGPSREQQAELRRVVEAMAGHIADLDRPSTPAGQAPSAPAVAIPALFDTVRLQVADVDSALSGVADTSAELAVLGADFRGLDRSQHQSRVVLALTARQREAEGEVAARLATEAGDLATGLEGVRRRLGDRVERIGRNLQRLHEDISRLRLIPTDVLWAFLDRVTRDAAQVLGKRARLETVSRTPRLDAPVFAGVQEALLHLVRNAIAHGLEPEAGRSAAGKPLEGLVRIRIEHGCARLRIVCEDDGGGIDTEAVRRAAIAKGWLAADTKAPLEMEEAIRLLLRGGVTTTRTANEVSGRGVGLDAVRAAAARLHGELTIRSTPGRGTVITLDVPVALSAVEVLAVMSGGAQWLLPVAAVQRVARTTTTQIRQTGVGEELNFDGQMFPYAALRHLAPTLVQPTLARDGQITVVIVQGGNGTAALGVDRLLGTIEAVVRPLPALVDASAFVAGASLDANGLPRLVIEADALIEAIRATGAKAAPTAAARAPILIVDDSLTTRMLEQSILESAGYVVDLAVSGEDALDRLRVHRYSLLLVDLEMPGINGFTLIERLRQNPAWRDIPAILVTSCDSREDRQRGFQAGAQDYVIKGEFDQRRLLQRIEELLS